MKIVNGIINLFRFDKTNWRVVALCLVAATVFWFFNALNKEHTATISFPLDFQYNQSAFIPVKAFPEAVRINITGSGWDLLRKSVGFKVQPLVVSLDRPLETRKLPPASVLALATAQFDQMKINHVVSDTLILSVDRRANKKVKLFMHRNQLKFKNGYGLSSDISISPDSVLVDGPYSIISQTPDSVSVELSMESIDGNVDAEGEINLSRKDIITVSTDVATIKFRASQLIDLVKKVKLVVFPSPPYRHQLFTDSVSVRFRVPSSLQDSVIRSQNLFAMFDLRQLDYGTTKTPPAIKGTIPFAEVVQVDSVMIKKY